MRTIIARALLLGLLCLPLGDPGPAWADMRSNTVTASTNAVGSAATLYGFYVRSDSAPATVQFLDGGSTSLARLTVFAPTHAGVFIPVDDGRGVGMDFRSTIYVDVGTAGAVTVFYK